MGAGNGLVAPKRTGAKPFDGGLIEPLPNPGADRKARGSNGKAVVTTAEQSAELLADLGAGAAVHRLADAPLILVTKIDGACPAIVRALVD